jgi:RNA polymerase-binding protein DksA
MTPEKIAHFKQRLLDERERLTQELQDFGKKDPNSPNHYTTSYPESGGNSDDDNAMEITEYSDDLSIEARLEAELKDTESALKSVEAGTYGACKYCGLPIDEKRLDARPASSSCISCKKILTQEM